MSAPTQQTEVRTVYVTCRLGKSELNRLFSLAPEGIPAASVAISTQRDSTRYSAGTLTDLVDHVRNSNASGNLDKWENLALDAADASGDRKLSINIDTERVEVQVAGTDATWVHGQAARIELLLQGAGGKEKREDATKKELIRLGKSFVLTSPMLVVGLVTVALVSPDKKSQEEEPLLPTLAPPVAMLAMVIVYWLGYKIISRANRALLMPTAEVPHGSWWSRATNGDKIGLGGLVVAFLALVVAALTLGKDLMK